MSWNIWDSLKLSLALGALIGFLMGVYLASDLLYPLFRDTVGLQSSYAVLVSLGIYFGGGVQLSLLGGGVFGLINFAMFFTCLYLPYRFCTRGKETIEAFQTTTCTETYLALGRAFGIRPRENRQGQELQDVVTTNQASLEHEIEPSDVEELENEGVDEEKEDSLNP